MNTYRKSQLLTDMMSARSRISKLNSPCFYNSIIHQMKIYPKTSAQHIWYLWTPRDLQQNIKWCSVSWTKFGLVAVCSVCPAWDIPEVNFQKVVSDRSAIVKDRWPQPGAPHWWFIGVNDRAVGGVCTAANTSQTSSEKSSCRNSDCDQILNNQVLQIQKISPTKCDGYRSCSTVNSEAGVTLEQQCFRKDSSALTTLTGEAHPSFVWGGRCGMTWWCWRDFKRSLSLFPKTQRSLDNTVSVTSENVTHWDVAVQLQRRVMIITSWQIKQTSMFFLYENSRIITEHD